MLKSKPAMWMMTVLGLTGFGVAGSEESASSPVEVTGIVFEDLNGNGAHDEGEPGIADVRVSDQVSVVSTGADGSFQLQSEGNYGVVYVSQPSGYRANGTFWRSVASESGEADLHFPLIKTDETVEFTFIHASDPHLSEETLPRMRRLREIVAEQNPAFVLITGDLIRDALRVGEEEATGLYELFVQELAAFPVPVWTALGNHEIFGIERHRSLVSPEHPLYGKQMYRSYLGPDYYSFDFAGVRFVCLDTVGVDDLWYYGYVDPAQLAWLREDLASLDSDTTLVSFSHLPLLSAGPSLFGYAEEWASPAFLTIENEPMYRHVVSNAEEVLDDLRDHHFSLALAGHFHTREKLSFETGGVQTRFHLTSAVREDYPSALGMTMISGVTLYRVSDGEIDDGTFIPLDPGP